MTSGKGRVKQNLTVIRDYFYKALLEGVDILVFPEMNLTGYFDNESYKKDFLELDCKDVTAVVNLTKGNNLTIIFGIAEKDGSNCFITQVVAQSGEIIGVYRKHNIVNKEADIFLRGKEEPIFHKNQLIYGVTICADIDLPNLYKKYSEAGCNIIFECASPDLYGSREKRDWAKGYEWWKNNCMSKIGSYAKQNNIMIAVATQRGRNEEDDFPGGGYLFSIKGDVIAETRDYRQDMLICELVL